METNEHNYLNAENEHIITKFNLDDVLDFQLKHNIQIIRGEDYQYMCYIDGKVYGIMFTFVGALVYGIINYNMVNNKND